MLNLLKTYFRKFLSDSHAAILGILFVTLASSGYAYSKYKTQLIATLNTNTPLWLTVSGFLLALLLSYLMVKYAFRQNDDSKWGDMFVVNGYKFYVNHSNGSILHIIEDPHCKKHELRMIKNEGYYICPREGCGSRIRISQLKTDWVKIKSELEKQVREY